MRRVAATRMGPPGLVGLGLVASLLACSPEPGLIRVEGSGFFDPAQLDYGVRAVGDTHELATRLRNASLARIQVSAIRFEPSLDVYAAFLTDGGTLRGTVLDPGQTVDIRLLYRPLSEGVYDATMVVEAVDIEIPLSISAEARQVAAGRPGLSPAMLQFGTVELGREVQQVVRVQNVGDTDGALAFVRTGPSFRVSDVGGAPLVLPTERLAPGEYFDVEVHFGPRQLGSVLDSVSFRFDTEQESQLTVRGDSVAPGELTCEPSRVELGTVRRGEEVSAEVRCQVSGGPYELEKVTLIQPEGERNFRLEPAEPQLAADGSLTFSVFYQALGLEGPHSTTIDIEPLHAVSKRMQVAVQVESAAPGASDFEVELTWNTDNSDFDLHVVRAGGQPFQRGADCYFEDKNPDWGDPEFPGDDPVLTGDVRIGFGPEKVSLLHARDGSYDVWVHYFTYAVGMPSTLARINYRLRDQSIQTVERQMNQCGEIWHVGRIQIGPSSATFTPVDSLSRAYVDRAGCPP